MAQRITFNNQPNEEFISTVDVWTLRRLRWPFLRLFARSFVERRELCRYEQSLLATGRWSMVRCSPHQSPTIVGAAPHLYDFYGVPER